MENITPVCQAFGDLPEHLATDTHESAKELLESRHRAFQVGFNHGLQPPSLQCFESKGDFDFSNGIFLLQIYLLCLVV